jgi:hypothetical protein
MDGPNLSGDWCIADTGLALKLNQLMSGEPVSKRFKNYAGGQ